MKNSKKITTLLLFTILMLVGCQNDNKQQSNGTDINSNIDKLISEGQFDKAFIEISSVINKNSNDIDTKITRSWVYNFQKNYSKALILLKDVLKEDPNNQEALFAVATVYKNLKDYDQSILNLEKIIKFNPVNDKVYEMMATIYEEKKLINKAEWAYKKAITIQPTESMYFLSLSNLYFKEGNYKLAIENCQKAYELTPANNKDNIKQTLENMKLKAILKKS